MLKEVIRDARSVPSRFVASQREARRWVKQRVFEAREQSETSLWELHLQALEGASGLIDRATTMPVLERVGPKAGELLEAYERVTTRPPIPDYDELNVRKVMSELHELDRFGLLRIQRYEMQHKNRKTILDAVEREMERRARLAATV